jgi:hypothetical protein
MLDTDFTGAEAIPGIGKAISALGSVGALGLAGYDAITGDSKGATQDLYGAENFALNALPVVGNVRTASQAAEDAGVVGQDVAGTGGQAQTAAGKFMNGGGAALNSSIGDTVKDFFQ